MQGNNCPILIEVTEEFVREVNIQIVTRSNSLLASKIQNFLPVDVVKIVGIPDRESIQLVEVDFST